jgi:serine/threonine protein phosphatase PrpC
MLAVSRAFGDFEYKSNTTLGPEEQAVSCIADVQVHKRDPERDLYLVLACDGVWDVMTNEQVGNFVSDEMTNVSQNVSLPDLGDSLLMECLQKGSRDNMSTIVASLQQQGSRPNATSSEDLPPPKALEFSSPSK